jgi:hypothetical protein
MMDEILRKLHFKGCLVSKRKMCSVTNIFVVFRFFLIYYEKTNIARVNSERKRERKKKRFKQ